MSYLGKDKRNDCGIHCSPQMRHSRGAEGVLLLTGSLIVFCIASVNKLNKDEFYMNYLIYGEFFFMDYLCSYFLTRKGRWESPSCRENNGRCVSSICCSRLCCLRTCYDHDQVTPTKVVSYDHGTTFRVVTDDHVTTSEVVTDDHVTTTQPKS